MMGLDKFNLSEKTALITGASGLLGYQHSAALIENGARVILTDLNLEDLSSTKSALLEEFKEANIFVREMDVTDSQNILSVYESLSKENIYVDILVNNAAIDPKVENKEDKNEWSRLENFSLTQWDKEISVGLTGAFLCSQIFGTDMASRGKGGVILNIASDLSVISPDQRLYRRVDKTEENQPVKPITYSVIKTGLIGLTMYLSTYWANKKVRCNALSPGGVKVNQSKEFVERLENLIPLGRMASPDEYRATVQYLCSDASEYLNGQNIVVDGGRSIL
tara:strand:+ start:898 stop:1734 length:837 start_codon:yes stop_codon:yes gene_type:complete